MEVFRKQIPSHFSFESFTILKKLTVVLSGHGVHLGKMDKFWRWLVVMAA